MILGLDISTSIIGYTVLEMGAKPYDQPVEMGHIDLRKCKNGFWDKVDTAQVAIENVVASHQVKKIFIENPLQKFRRGLSSAHTISLLSKFNALCSYFARQASGLDPEYIDATQARKQCGIPIKSRKKSGGKTAKEQTFDFLCTNVFENKDWPRTKKKNLQAYCWDQVDSYVIALAGAVGVLNT